MNSGYIVQKDGVWGFCSGIDMDIYIEPDYKTFIPIHHNHISTVIENGCVKPEYSGEVEYEVKEESVQSISTEGDYLRSYTIETYAIPKPIESKVDVWEEDLRPVIGNAIMYYSNPVATDEIINYLKQHYTLTKNK